MKTLAEMDIQTMGRKYPLRMAVMAKGPAALRMETIPLIGPPDFMLSITGDQLRVYFPEKGEYYMGEASRHLSRFFPVPIDVQDMVSILMGVHPPLKSGDCFVPDLSTGDLRQINVLNEAGKIRMSLWIKWPEQLLVRLTKFDGNEKTDYMVAFSEYSMTDQIPMPERIIIRRGNMAGLRQTISIRYSDLEWTHDVEERSFELAIPPGVRPIELKGEGAQED